MDLNIEAAPYTSILILLSSDALYGTLLYGVMSGFQVAQSTACHEHYIMRACLLLVLVVEAAALSASDWRKILLARLITERRRGHFNVAYKWNVGVGKRRRIMQPRVPFRTLSKHAR